MDQGEFASRSFSVFKHTNCEERKLSTYILWQRILKIRDNPVSYSCKTQPCVHRDTTIFQNRNMPSTRTSDSLPTQSLYLLTELSVLGRTSLMAACNGILPALTQGVMHWIPHGWGMLNCSLYLFDDNGPGYKSHCLEGLSNARITACLHQHVYIICKASQVYVCRVDDRCTSKHTWPDTHKHHTAPYTLPHSREWELVDMCISPLSVHNLHCVSSVKYGFKREN